MRAERGADRRGRSGGAGLQLGFALISPGRRSRGRALVESGILGAKLVFGVFARSVMDEVGRPTTKKNASIFLSLMALTDSATPRRSLRMSFS